MVLFLFRIVLKKLKSLCAFMLFLKRKIWNKNNIGAVVSTAVPPLLETIQDNEPESKRCLPSRASLVTRSGTAYGLSNDEHLEILV